MIIEEMEKQNIEALKAKDKEKRAILSVVINRYRLAAIELKAQGKAATDEDMIRVIAKSLKELTDEKEGFIKVGNTARAEAIKTQEDELSKFLPKMLSEEEILLEIKKLDDKTIPNIMKHFKNNFPGKVDMGLVNRLARTL